MKLAFVVGARPQFIKHALLEDSFHSKAEDATSVLIHTNQHYDPNMSEVFFEEMGMRKPDYTLPRPGSLQGEMTGHMLKHIEEILMKEKPDALVIYGDTNSTLAGALAAVKLHIPVAHVEAGLRSWNMQMPEEVNRIVADRCSSLFFVPTEVARENLLKEGSHLEDIIETGDIMYDAALHFIQRAESRPESLLEKYQLNSDDYVLCTFHRAGNTDDAKRLKGIVEGLCALGEKHKIVIPLHPRTKKALEREGLLETLESSVLILDPLGYLDMLVLEKNAKFIITDSGGVQKEAYYFQKSALILRSETEWVELVDAGIHFLCDVCDEDWPGIAEKAEQLNKEEIPSGIYGRGDAASLMAEALLEMIENTRLVCSSRE